MAKKYILLILIILLAAFLRFWQLENIPSGIHADEVSATYTGYSLLKTGLEPHGVFDAFAFEDNNTGGRGSPLYIYSLIPLIKIFGLGSVMMLRSPSAIFGILTVLLLFLIIRRLFNSYKVAFLGSFLLTVNPWAIHISRAALAEAISLFFITLGIYLFLASKARSYLLIFSALSFGLSLYSYDAPKIFLPPFLLLIFYFQKDILSKAKKYFITFILIFFIFYAFMLNLTFLRGGLYHFSRASVFENIAENVNSERYLTKAPLWLSSAFHNKLTVSLKRFETSYVSIFSFNWFFINGSGNLQHAVGNHGEFFLFELPFFFIGLYLAFKKSIKVGAFLLGWMLIGALPGGLTSGNYAYRSVLLLPVPIIFSAYGIVYVWNLLSRIPYLFRQYILKLGLVIIMIVFISSYLFTYFFDYPVYASEYWNKQQNDAIKFLQTQKDKYAKIFVDGGEPWAITYAYFSKLNPALYQQAYVNQFTYNGKKIIKIDNIYFGIFNLEYLKNAEEFFPKKSLLITSDTSFPKSKYVKAFFDPGGIRAIFKAIEVE